jgi:hypothetical protein
MRVVAYLRGNQPCFHQSHLSSRERVSEAQNTEVDAQKQGLTDYPAAVFPEELIKAYPNAKIILTVRDEDKWFDSMMATLVHQRANAPEDPRDMASVSTRYHRYCVSRLFSSSLVLPIPVCFDVYIKFP